MTIIESRQPEIKSNWWRLVLYFLLVIIGAGIFYIPIFVFRPELLSIPRDEFDKAFETPLMGIAGILAMSAGVLFATYFMVNKIECRSLRSIRLTVNFKEFIHGGAFAIIIFSLFVLVGEVFQVIHITYQGFSVSLLYSFILYFLVAFNEELLCRGYIFSNLLEKMSPVWALFASSAFFGLIHYGNDHFTWIGCLTISISGFLMGLLVLKGGSLSSAIGCHWVWNFMQGPVMGFEVSGHNEHGIFKPMLLADDIFTGGSFGGEGSVILAGITALIAFGIWFKAEKTR